jgi:hypothetical protein
VPRSIRALSQSDKMIVSKVVPLGIMKWFRSVEP